MEHRPKLRIALLHVFGCFCQLGADFVSTLLCSVLPTELAQDLMQDQSDMTKFLTTSLMLTMIFSTGEPVPYHHYVQVILLSSLKFEFLRLVCLAGCWHSSTNTHQPSAISKWHQLSVCVRVSM